MSTKTTFKRIALVAAVALGLGGLSTVPASAAEATPTNIVISKATTQAGTALAAGKYVADKLLNTNGVSSITVTASTAIVLKAIPVGGASQNNSSYRLQIGNAIWDTEANAAGVADGTAETANTFTAPAAAGTYTATLTYDEDADYTTTDDQRKATFTLIVAGAAGWSQGASTVLSAPTHVLPTTTTDALSKTAVKTLGTYGGTIVATIRNSEGALYTGQTVTATVSGVGFVGGASVADPFADADVDTADGAAVTTRSVSVTDTTGRVAFAVWADGLAGTSTVTISLTDQVSGATTVIGTETVTFYGSVTKLAISETVYTIGRAGGATTGAADADLDDRTAAHIPAFVVKQTDSGGNVANGGAPSIVSDNLLAVTGGACALDDNADADYSSGGTGFYNCNFVTATTAKSGDKATLTVRIVDPADATKYLSTTYAVTVGGTVSKETISFDKTSYSPGEAIVITRTAVDASGNPVYDGAAAPAITFNKAVGGTAPAASVYVGGKKATSATTPSVFAPAQAGEFTARATSGNAAGDTISASATVVDEKQDSATDAANEATDAANAATDAALAAADAADAATAAAQDASDAVAALSAEVSKMISSLKAQITSLTNLVIKIQKKVKA